VFANISRQIASSLPPLASNDSLPQTTPCKNFLLPPEEWQMVADAAWPHVSATWARDDAVRDSAFLTLQEVLHDLRAKYGDHPILLETEADFTHDEQEQLRLYRAAIAIANKHGLQTLTIRLSLASLLLHIGPTEDAIAELSACKAELPDGDEYQRESWYDLVSQVTWYDERREVEMND
jgi:hypothetical protein